MRTTSRLTAAVLAAGTAVLSCAGPALADDTASPSPSPSGSAAAPTEAGTNFRTATAIQQGQAATATASTGDYLYWMVPAAAGQNVTVKATVTLPESSSRHGSATWRLDVYDGLRRRQACAAGHPSRTAAVEDTTVELRCRLRTVRPWSEAWANDPLPGAYYVRLTVADLPDQDLGLPASAEILATAADAGGSKAADGELAAPLTPVEQAGATLDPDAEAGATPSASASASEEPASLAAPDGGWSPGWWSDRWIWTVAGGVLGALAGVAGYNFARPSRRREQQA
ncbi:hypothetical protein [Streptomyces sp. NBC_01262]|uniref:hypothetical protein n=1 Tax=Streptomyces sp. NBC_01262 TaxID=2903803 RepID=UPI002E3070A0|nr:hypothetical protein [Streptomyces sp. NBC_01262]